VRVFVGNPAGSDGNVVGGFSKYGHVDAYNEKKQTKKTIMWGVYDDKSKQVQRLTFERCVFVIYEMIIYNIIYSYYIL
jgi:hypothetical protein